jgi:ribonuclease HI
MYRHCVDFPARKYEFSLPIVATLTNNQAEYQALKSIGWDL